MLGGLHIDMALWSTLGDILQSSGWTSALTESGVASSGTADSFLKVAHLVRTRHVHQVANCIDPLEASKGGLFAIRKQSI